MAVKPTNTADSVSFVRSAKSAHATRSARSANPTASALPRQVSLLRIVAHGLIEATA